jgi:ribose/xylose/arabinose/galactoside ABC-type transport system permease subunit
MRLMVGGRRINVSKAQSVPKQMQPIYNGLTLLSVNAYYQEIVRGLVLLLAVALDQIRKREGT